jgi:hypothetical protein
MQILQYNTLKRGQTASPIHVLDAQLAQRRCGLAVQANYNLAKRKRAV